MSASPYPLRASFAPVWGHCSGSVIASMRVPHEDTEETADGTAAHWVASECLTCWKEGGTAWPHEWLHRTAPNGVVIDEEITDAVHVYVQHVLELAQKYGALSTIMVEHRVHMPHIHDANGGTLDCAIWAPEVKVLHLVDYKHGHRHCAATGNLQLVDYVAGLFNELKINGYEEQHVDVHMTIVQPRCYHGSSGPFNSWSVKMSDLRAYWNHLSAQAYEALGTSPTLTSGAHCRDCPAILDCPAARMSAASLIDYVKQPFAVEQMTPAQQATEREWLGGAVGAAKARLESIEDALRHAVAQGNSDGTGLALDTSYSRRKWTDEAGPLVVRSLGAAFGIDAMKEVPITPTQFVDRVPADKREAAERTVKQVSSRQVTGQRLVACSDSLPARVFAKKQEL